MDHVIPHYEGRLVVELLHHFEARAEVLVEYEVLPVLRHHAFVE